MVKYFRENILKKFSTTTILLTSFALVICLGTFFLSLPISNKTEVDLINHLFTATSATCVTGLLTLNISNQYTTFGQVVIIILIQVGGLGLMTFLVTFLTFIKKNLFFAEKKIIQDSLNKVDMQDIPKYIRNIFLYTLIFEGLGFILFSIKFIPEFGLARGLFNSLFLSVSSFCNAGMDNFSNSSLSIYASDFLVNITVCFLIITGGLGFAVWFELKDLVKKLKTKSLKYLISRLSLHTKVVLSTTIFLLLSGLVLILILEYKNVLNDFNFFEKILVSFLHSTSLRTAGFYSVDLGSLKSVTIFIMCLYMFIGGSSGGTAGGIKTGTLVVMLVSLRSGLKNDGRHFKIFSREIPKSTLTKAFVVTFMYFAFLFVALCLLLITDERYGLLNLMFEAVSAIATVGLSVGITSDLSLVGKLIIIGLMYIGRLGPITVLLSVYINKKKDDNLTYASEEIIVG